MLFFIYIYIYIKISKIYQLNVIKKIKKAHKKKLVKDFKIFLKKKNKKNQQYGCERYKHISEDEKIIWLSMEKKIL